MTTEEARAKRRAYYEANREEILAKKRAKGPAYFQANKDRFRLKRRAWRYGVSVETSAQIQTTMVCEITGWPLDDQTRCTDHCHEGGHLRGVLHRRINAALGMFGDDPALLRAAADYLELRSDPAFEWGQS